MFSAETTMPPATNPLLDTLNESQREAVVTTEGPVLVLAGAGTGKTRVLTSRIAHILQQNLAFPSQILAVTFTNKAAREMQHRIEGMAGPNAGGLWLGTFHSIGVKILRRHAELVGLKSSFTILDDDDQMRLLKNLMAEYHIDDKRWPVKTLSYLIQRFKDRGYTPEKVPADEVSDFAGGKLLQLYTAYQARLKSLSATDFGDLLLHMLTLFLNNPDILSEYQRRFKYILVDEYQDTNVAQYLWLRLLAQGHRNICCVGDDDQSIYSWRGAEVANILKFDKDFPDAKTIRLERNYRSTKDILAAASGLIAYNKGRLGKTLWTDDESTNKVKVISLWDDRHEAQYVAQEIDALQSIHKVKPSDIAVLVRAGFQTRAFEECFISAGIPYRVVGGLRFYERMEIRDMIAYLRLIAQGEDDLAFERIINTPKRGIGKGTLDDIRNFARGMHISLFEGVRKMVAQTASKNKTTAVLELFVKDRDRWAEEAAILKPRDLAEKVMTESGYKRMWESDKSTEAEGRLENLKELLTALDEFETLEGFLEHVSLVTDIEEMDQASLVNVMTLHAAKGLEFPAVFLPGWEEGIFPHQRALDESGGAGLEEERRLAYVGITRARKWLTISFVANRRVYNQWQNNLPSRFVDELPSAHIDQMNMGTGNTAQRSTAPQSSYGFREKTAHTYQGPMTKAAAPIVQAASSHPYPVGTRIFHIKFGYGSVAKVDGQHLTIKFDKAGIKTVVEDYVKKV
ncbi:MAG: DNA helicase II [Proteobacteria bacterium]|nr:DNA helicase II [Pseudomonadota bacterium]